jgi:hypothetical protein
MAQNGRLPDSDLAPIAQGRLRKDAAAAWNTMNIEARSRGLELVPTGSASSYRTYDQQVYFWNLYQSGQGALAARPGNSNHGWGLAVDTPDQRHWNMIQAIGAKYGYQKAWSDAPSEPWHVKYREGVWSGNDPGPYGSGLTEEDIVAITACIAANGNFHVFVEAKDGTVWYTWQAKDSTGWSGGAPGKGIAGLSFFAPAPGK